MSNSTKKTKITGVTTAKSEKDDKREANRKLRRITKQKVKKGDLDLPQLREISNIWSFAKDGKIYKSDMEEKYLRK